MQTITYCRRDLTIEFSTLLLNPRVEMSRVFRMDENSNWSHVSTAILMTAEEFVNSCARIPIPDKPPGDQPMITIDVTYAEMLDDGACGQTELSVSEIETLDEENPMRRAVTALCKRAMHRFNRQVSFITTLEGARR